MLSIKFVFLALAVSVLGAPACALHLTRGTSELTLPRSWRERTATPGLALREEEPSLRLRRELTAIPKFALREEEPSRSRRE
ncbi:hypothetical protein FB451DRAFT_1378112 [Mycena latifolia]|nr:hypothetical protein FB451DRAFT_1378112 [Mycena latifolia]